MRRNALVVSVGIGFALSLAACSSGGSSPSAASKQLASIQTAESQAATAPPASAPPASAPPASASPDAGGPDASSTDTAAPAGFNPCSFLSVSKAGSITGNKFSGAKADQVDRGDYTCTFSDTGDGSALLMDVAIPSADTSWDDAVAAVTSGGTPMNVAGVGKRAVAGGIGFIFDTGKYYISFEFADESGDKNAIALAKQILTAPGVS